MQFAATFAGAGAMWSEMQALLDHDLRQANESDIKRLIVDENVLAKKTRANRLECLKKLTKRYGLSTTDAPYAVFLELYYKETSPIQRGLMAYVLLASHDALLRRLGSEWVAPKLRQNGTPLSTMDLAEYFAKLSKSEPDIGTWTELTRFRMCQHLLGLIRDCGLAKGTRLKRSVRPQPGNMVLLYVLKLGLLQRMAPVEILRSDWFTMLSLDLDTSLRRMYEMNSDGLIKFRLQGSVAELTIIS
jgi:hypothetical protein